MLLLPGCIPTLITARSWTPVSFAERPVLIGFGTPAVSCIGLLRRSIPANISALQQPRIRLIPFGISLIKASFRPLWSRSIQVKLCAVYQCRISCLAYCSVTVNCIKGDSQPCFRHCIFAAHSGIIACDSDINRSSIIFYKAFLCSAVCDSLDWITKARIC